jgi:hypothetical protein
VQHTTKVTTASRLYAPRYAVECSCGWNCLGASWQHRTQAAAAGEEHLERSENAGDSAAWDLSAR